MLSFQSMNQAILYLIIATSVFSIINVMVKMLEGIASSEIVFFRALISLFICLFFILRKGKSVWGTNKKILFLRGFFGTLSLFSFFMCLQNMPLALAMTLINFAPLFTVLIAHFILKEKAHGSQWFFLLGSLFGVYLIRGETDPVPILWILLGLFAALSAAAAYTCVRHLRTTEDPLVVIFYFPLVTLPTIGPIMLWQWQTPGINEWLLLIAIGVLTQVAQYYMTLAYQLETAAKVMVFNYAGLLWGALLGWAIFNEELSPIQILGLIVVFTCLWGQYLLKTLSKKGVR